MTDQAHDTAVFFSLTHDSPVRVLHRLTDLAVRRVLHCSGATATLWEPGEVMSMAATHPDTAVLAAVRVRPGALDRSDLHLASLLTFGAVSMADAAEYVTAQRTAAQLQEAIRSRAVVDQAKRILMQLVGCDGDQAFERLLLVSQARHVKLTEVARQVVDTRAVPR